ncbi:related to N-acetyltransferase [Cephalotrichum gorgonifer]|uniref:Related to N-acetyltransferase n=1 Tax=Cephalotrichum gorgonifer TaxID=2041049 RepID=A0AAE8MRP4_9PEZI|nr:related to N-acetyltransferase [Cephalotrichum gorgonifer]
MKFNEHIAVSTPRLLLVPYEAHHVPRYHTWMKDPEIQELTASEPLSLDEEYENQVEWRQSGDKLTFILCLPRPQTLASDGAPGVDSAESGGGAVRAGVDDAEDRMVGDINLFIYPDQEEEDSDRSPDDGGVRRVFGEVDVMVASSEHRRKGLGKAAVKTLLGFMRRNLSAILSEYALSSAQAEGGGDGRGQGPVELTRLVVKIKDKNEASKILFGGLGFVPNGGVNYFGEVEMVFEGLGGALPWEDEDRESYEEVQYSMGG